MTSTMNVDEATLPELLKRVELGDTIVLIAGTSKLPIATLTPASTPGIQPRRLGFLEHSGEAEISDSVWFDPLPEEELRLWEDGGPDDPLNWSEERIQKANSESNARWK